MTSGKKWSPTKFVSLLKYLPTCVAGAALANTHNIFNNIISKKGCHEGHEVFEHQRNSYSISQKYALSKLVEIAEQKGNFVQKHQ